MVATYTCRCVAVCLGDEGSACCSLEVWRMAGNGEASACLGSTAAQPWAERPPGLQLQQGMCLVTNRCGAVSRICASRMVVRVGDRASETLHFLYRIMGILGTQPLKSRPGHAHGNTTDRAKMSKSMAAGIALC